jgi:uncharacterized membrane protein
MMLQGHTVDALLNVAARHGQAFSVWTTIRGLTPSTFLFLSGCAFGVVTFGANSDSARHAPWPKRLRRSLFLLVLGYALHYPAANVAALMQLSGAEWRPFLAVDVLQCIGVTLIGLTALTYAVETRRRFIASSLIVCALVVLGSPMIWQAAWAESVPAFLGGYLTPGIGSLFPLFPWFGYSVFGAAVGAFINAHHESESSRWRLLMVGGLVMAAAGAAARLNGWDPWIQGATAAASPSQFLQQAGAVLLILSVIGLLLGRSRPQPSGRIVETIARESLLIYAVHLCLVYGSPWNKGLRQYLGPTLSMPHAVFWVVIMWTVVGALAVVWRRMKDTSHVAASRMRLATAVVLGAGLLY